ncbi:MAG: hypothetical protein IKY70_03775 [Bacteroidales bacterium]|nr:hypothetical protein [Bacteroidales bacterium]
MKKNLFNSDSNAYEAPSVYTINVSVERGFAASGGTNEDPEEGGSDDLG